MKSKAYKAMGEAETVLNMNWNAVDRKKRQYQQDIISKLQISSRDGFASLIDPFDKRNSAETAVNVVQEFFKTFEYEEPDVALFQVNITQVASRRVVEKGVDPGVKLLLEVKVKMMPNDPISKVVPNREEIGLQTTYVISDRTELVEAVVDVLGDALHRAGQRLIDYYYDRVAEKDTKAAKNGGKSD